MKYKPDHSSKEHFLDHVREHEIKVIRDDGLHRHLRFKKQNTSNQYFDLITWPGTLCIHGDMGTFVFSRIDDMFAFFRDDKGELRINTGYWSEKLDAADRRTGGHEEFKPEKFRRRVMEIALESGADRATLREIKSRLGGRAEYGEQEAYRAASEFSHNGFRFYDFWEIRCGDYTYHFVWCCYAIVWGIQKYDELKARTENAEAA